MDIKQKLGKAKAMLVIEQPFIATLALGLPIIITDNLNPPTLATDMKQIYVHPAWVEKHTVKQVMWALGHETFHCVLQHCLPQYWGNRVNGDKRNIAQDYVINWLLEQDMPGNRPDGVYFSNEIYKQGKGTWEGIYDIIPDPPPQGGGGAWDMAQPAEGDPAEQAEMHAVWEVKVAQAAAAAKAQGKLSKHLEAFIGELLNPKVPWEDVLRKFCMRAVKSERSFARPARRWLHRGMYMPGQSGFGMGDILVALDESGSVTPEEVRRFASELQGIKDDAKPACIHVVHFAGQVDHYESFGPDDPLDIKRRTTGGTAFSPIFRYAADNGIEPDCCVVLTDLYCNDFGPHPDYPVLWVTTAATNAPWGEVISIRD